MTFFALTMGCPVGIGPEIIVKYWSETDRAQRPPLVVVGDLGVLRHCAAQLAPPLSLHRWQPGDPLPGDGLPVYSVSMLPEKSLRWGQPSQATGQAMADYIRTAVALINAGSCAGMVTAPISKAALRMAGHTYPGHTEMLAELTGTTSYRMLMAGDRLKVMLATIHCPLREVPGLLNRRNIAACLRDCARSLRDDFGITSPRIAVAGLNPHAGEDGLFGDEEQLHIGPAVQDAQANGILASGPHPPDTVFWAAATGKYDAVICMYHDQGLIPFKLLHFHNGVNVTCGLPIVRTSVDHGTAYDIAGRGQADFQSLAAAVNMATVIAANRRRVQQREAAP